MKRINRPRKPRKRGRPAMYGPRSCCSEPRCPDKPRARNLCAYHYHVAWKRKRANTALGRRGRRDNR